MSPGEPELRGSAPPDLPPPRGCFPLRALIRLFSLLLLTLLILYGIVLLVARSNGFRDLLAERLSTALGDTVTLTETRLNPDLTFELRGIDLPHELPTAGCRIGRARFRVDWPASLAAKSLVYGRFEAADIELDIVESADGSRQPEALLGLIGLQRWRGGEESTEAGRERMEKLLRAVEKVETPAKTTPGRLVVDGNRMQMRFLGLNIRLFDAAGVKQLEFADVVVGFDPGLDPDPVLPPKPRYRVHGLSRVPQGPDFRSTPIALDLLYNEGQWVLLEFEAESRLLFWMNRVLAGEMAGPLAENVTP